jgi:hypothetical protein
VVRLRPACSCASDGRHRRAILPPPHHPPPLPAPPQEGLEFLSLQNVGASVHACKAVDELLQHTATLKGIHLFNNMSGDEGAGYIAKVLARSPAMADFKMASSRVGPAGGIALARGLSAGEDARGVGGPACRGVWGCAGGLGGRALRGRHRPPPAPAASCQQPLPNASHPTPQATRSCGWTCRTTP